MSDQRQNRPEIRVPPVSKTAEEKLVERRKDRQRAVLAEQQRSHPSSSEADEDVLMLARRLRRKRLCLVHGITDVWASHKERAEELAFQNELTKRLAIGRPLSAPPVKDPSRRPSTPYPGQRPSNCQIGMDNLGTKRHRTKSAVWDRDLNSTTSSTFTIGLNRKDVSEPVSPVSTVSTASPCRKGAPPPLLSLESEATEGSASEVASHALATDSTSKLRFRPSSKSLAKAPAPAASPARSRNSTGDSQLVTGMRPQLANGRSRSNSSSSSADKLTQPRNRHTTAAIGSSMQSRSSDAGQGLSGSDSFHHVMVKGRTKVGQHASFRDSTVMIDG